MRKTISVMIAGAVLLTGCTLLPPEQEEPPVDVLAPQVTEREIAPVRRGSIVVRQSLNVTFGSEQQLPAYFRQGGRLRKLHVTMGQTVAAGALLAELEPGGLPYDLSLAEIEYRKAKLSLDKAKSRLGFTDGPSEWDLQRLELDLEQAALRLKRQQDLLAETRIYATYGGRVLSVSAAEGEMVEAFKSVLLLAGEGPALARATVDEATAMLLQAGQLADILPNDGNSLPVKGKVQAITPIGSAARESVVMIVPDRPDERLSAGRMGKAEVTLRSKENVLVVPLSAVRTFGGRKFVTVVAGGARKEVAIKTGLENDTHAEVLEGLKEGDQVVSR